MLWRRQLSNCGVGCGDWRGGVELMESRAWGGHVDSPGSQTARVAGVVDAADAVEGRRVRWREKQRRRVYGFKFGTGDEVM
jgi:hypothetical protein